MLFLEFLLTYQNSNTLFTLYVLLYCVKRKLGLISAALSCLERGLLSRTVAGSRA